MTEPLLALANTTVVRSGETILEQVSLGLYPGERLAIVGQNGAGKTTLLRTLIGLQKVTSGEVRAFGRKRETEADFRDVRIKAAYLFQDPDDQLFCPTVLEDVAFGPMNLGLSRTDSLTKAAATLSDLDLSHLQDRITHRLSGGEKRMVSLAAVLVMDPQVLLLDEPTNALDDNHLAQLTSLLASLKSSMILVSHDRNFVESLATRAVLLNQRQLSPAVIHRHPHTHDHIHFHEQDASHDHDSPGAHRHDTPTQI